MSVVHSVHCDNTDVNEQRYIPSSFCKTALVWALSFSVTLHLLTSGCLHKNSVSNREGPNLTLSKQPKEVAQLCLSNL